MTIHSITFTVFAIAMIFPGSSAPIIAARLARNRRKIFEAFRTSSATSPTNAKTLSEIGIKSSNLFRTQVRRKVIVQVENEKFYLDEAREREMDRLRHRIVASVISAMLIFLLIMLLYR